MSKALTTKYPRNNHLHSSPNNESGRRIRLNFAARAGPWGKRATSYLRLPSCLLFLPKSLIINENECSSFLVNRYNNATKEEDDLCGAGCISPLCLVHFPPQHKSFPSPGYYTPSYGLCYFLFFMRNERAKLLAWLNRIGVSVLLEV